MRQYIGMLLECEICGKLRFVTASNLQRYKSTKCSVCVRKFRKPYKAKPKTCQNCGKVIMVKPSIYNRKKFCSRKCQQTPIQKKSCSYCQSSFETKRARSKFCTRDCARNARKERFPKRCKTCAVLFWVTKCRLDAQYCSRSCYTMKGTRNPNYKNGHYAGKSHAYPYGGKWPVIRKYILERDSHQCQYPGCNSVKNLEVHHIIKFSKFNSIEEANDPSNLIILCKAHHAKMEPSA